MSIKTRRLSISRKLTLIYSSILFGILIVFTLLIFFSIRNIIIKDSESQLSSSANMISNYITATQSIEPSSFNNISLTQGTSLSIFDDKGSLIYSSNLNSQPIGKHGDGRGKGYIDRGFEREKETMHTR